MSDIEENKDNEILVENTATESKLWVDNPYIMKGKNFLNFLRERKRYTKDSRKECMYTMEKISRYMYPSNREGNKKGLKHYILILTTPNDEIITFIVEEVVTPRTQLKPFAIFDKYGKLRYFNTTNGKFSSPHYVEPTVKTYITSTPKSNIDKYGRLVKYED